MYFWVLLVLGCMYHFFLINLYIRASKYKVYLWRVVQPKDDLLRYLTKAKLASVCKTYRPKREIRVFDSFCYKDYRYSRKMKPASFNITRSIDLLSVVDR